MDVMLAISAAINVMLLVKYLAAKNSVMAIMAYIKIHRLPMPSEAEMKVLCAEAWRQMFSRER